VTSHFDCAVGDHAMSIPLSLYHEWDEDEICSIDVLLLAFAFTHVIEEIIVVRSCGAYALCVNYHFRSRLYTKHR
jgi:hypothetical protein